MKIYAIRDEVRPKDALTGYLVYYENAKAFYVELEDGLDPWDAPPVFSELAARGEYSIGRYRSLRWVRSRIVPRDRQNIGQILRENRLAGYDEHALLMLSMGRCEQDDLYLEEVPCDPLPGLLERRWKTKVEDAVPLTAPNLLVFFRNGLAKIIRAEDIDDGACGPFLAVQERFDRLEVEPDGYGVGWGERACLPHGRLFSAGVTVPLAPQDLERYLQTRVVSAAEACGILGCSRQNIDDLVKRGKLHPIRTDARYKLFSKAEVMQRKRETQD